MCSNTRISVTSVEKIFQSVLQIIHMFGILEEFGTEDYTQTLHVVQNICEL